MKNFWHDLPRPFFVLAPMEAVTDVVFRHVINAAGRPDVFFTEFTNAASYYSDAGRPSTRGRLAFTPEEQPMVAQIWGNKPEHFEFMAKGLKEQGFTGVDINMGCPAKDVVKTGGGCGMISNPQLAAEVIAAAKLSGLPVSVKTRLGDVRADEWNDWLSHILRQDIVNLTIHLRSRKEMSKVPAHYELIPAIKKLRDEIAPQTLLTINGDIRDRAHGMELVEQYGIDGIMIGRGIFTNPFAFARIEETSLPSFTNSLQELPRRSLDSGPAARATPPSLTLFGSGGVAPSRVTRASVGTEEFSDVVGDTGILAGPETQVLDSPDRRGLSEALLNKQARVSQSTESIQDLGLMATDEQTVEATREESGGDESGIKKQKLLNLLNLHLDLFDKYSVELEPRKFDPLKRFFKIYVRDFPGASELREALMHTKSTDEVRQLIKS